MRPDSEPGDLVREYVLMYISSLCTSLHIYHYLN